MATVEDVVKVPVVTLPLRARSVPGAVVASTGSAPLHVMVTGERMLCEAESEKERPEAVA
jgi:hypothetical protein